MLDRYTGKKFNSLLVLSYSHSGKSSSGKNKHYYKIQCDCGNIKTISSDSLMNGSKTCGCSKIIK